MCGGVWVGVCLGVYVHVAGVPVRVGVYVHVWAWQHILACVGVSVRVGVSMCVWACQQMWACLEWTAYDCVSMTHPPVLDASQAVVVLLGDHEGGQVGRVAGREDDREQRPDVAEEAAGHAPRIIDIDRSAEQHRPDEPE